MNRKPKSTFIKSLTWLSNGRNLTFAATIGINASTLGLSMFHLAEGIELTTHIPTWQAWTMAAAIDLNMVVAELHTLLERADGWLRTRIYVGLILSGIFNCMAFTAHAGSPKEMTGGIILGVLVPVVLYATTHAAHKLKGRKPKAEAKPRAPAKPKLTVAK